jgi:ribosome-binding protein aMBF1 (putative translation factor)
MDTPECDACTTETKGTFMTVSVANREVYLCSTCVLEPGLLEGFLTLRNL